MNLNKLDKPTLNQISHLLEHLPADKLKDFDFETEEGYEQAFDILKDKTGSQIRMINRLLIDKKYRKMRDVFKEWGMPLNNNQ